MNERVAEVRMQTYQALFLAIVFALAAALLPSFVAADAPLYVPVQGYLTDAGGLALDAPANIRFRLYGTSTPTGAAGEILHEETLAVVVSKGHFTVFLGDNVALDLAIFRDHPVVFLGMRIGTDADETKPLLQVATAPFAGFAQYCGDALTVGGSALSSLATAAHKHAYTDLTDRPAPTCPAGQFVRSVSAAGVATCEKDKDRIAAYGTLYIQKDSCIFQGVNAGTANPTPASGTGWVGCDITITGVSFDTDKHLAFANVAGEGRVAAVTLGSAGKAQIRVSATNGQSVEDIVQFMVIVP